jgi:hypothetical protein
VDEGTMLGYSNDIARVLQMFIHQQYTGRVLTFALVLGYQCESLALECERFLDEVDHVTRMDVCIAFSLTALVPRIDRSQH